jgi:hypothetical protein
VNPLQASQYSNVNSTNNTTYAPILSMYTADGMAYSMQPSLDYGKENFSYFANQNEANLDEENDDTSSLNSSTLGKYRRKTSMNLANGSQTCKALTKNGIPPQNCLAPSNQ